MNFRILKYKLKLIHCFAQYAFSCFILMLGRLRIDEAYKKLSVEDNISSKPFGTLILAISGIGEK